MSKETGRLKWFNDEKGYGFITPDSGERDVFVHVSAFQQSNIKNREDGMKLSYDVGESRGKSCAVNLESNDE